MESPIFIFSLPRSGSTLLQRVLMSHEDISSVAEPWILLPQLFFLKEEGLLSVYSHKTSIKGINGFVDNLPLKEKDYNLSLSNFISDLYSKQCKNGEKYFLDKTPRYYYIINDIVDLFPNAKFIFLFRNPTHILASVIRTWGNSRLMRIFKNENDITSGFEMLSNAYQKYGDISISISYEDFVTNPEHELNKISDYLKIHIGNKALSEFNNQETKGELGDPTGVKQYKTLSNEGLTKWKTILNSRFRKIIAKKILKKISETAYETQGYNKQQIISDLENINNLNDKMFFVDVIDFFRSYLIFKFKLNLIFKKDFYWFRKHFIS